MTSSFPHHYHERHQYLSSWDWAAQQHYAFNRVDHHHPPPPHSFHHLPPAVQLHQPHFGPTSQLLIAPPSPSKVLHQQPSPTYQYHYQQPQPAYNYQQPSPTYHYQPHPHPQASYPPHSPPQRPGQVRRVISPVASPVPPRRPAGMSMFKKGLIFASFLGCCIAMALEAAAMATKHWVVSEARRRFDNGTLDFSSDGRVNFGLFRGSKALNYGYGTRVFLIDVTSIIVDEGEYMVWGLWIATLVCLVAAMVFSFIGALFGVINVATNPINALPGPIGLYVWNIAAIILNSLVIVTWVAQFNAKLKGNVMDRNDRSHQWTSKGMATIGYSMWLILGAIIVHLMNIAAVVCATHTRKPKRELVSHTSPSKVQGAIMLY